MTIVKCEICGNVSDQLRQCGLTCGRKGCNECMTICTDCGLWHCSECWMTKSCCDTPTLCGRSPLPEAPTPKYSPNPPSYPLNSRRNRFGNSRLFRMSLDPSMRVNPGQRPNENLRDASDDDVDDYDDEKGLEMFEWMPMRIREFWSWLHRLEKERPACMAIAVLNIRHANAWISSFFHVCVFELNEWNLKMIVLSR